MTIIHEDNILLDADNFDTSQFWKDQEELTNSSMNKKLFSVARHGPASEFISILNNQKSSNLPSHCVHSIDLDVLDSSSWTPLIHASFNGHTEIVQHMIKYQEEHLRTTHGDELVTDADFEIDDDKIEMTTETELKYKYLYKKFLTRKVKWNGSSALHLACARGHDAVVRLLIHKMLIEYKMSVDATINVIDFDMATPLHCAVLGKHYKICQILLDSGAAIDRSDIRGKTALDWAKERSLTKYVSLLSEYANKEKRGLKSSVDAFFDDEPNIAKLVESIWENEECERKSMECSFNELELMNVTPTHNPHYAPPQNGYQFAYWPNMPQLNQPQFNQPQFHQQQQQLSHQQQQWQYANNNYNNHYRNSGNKSYNYRQMAPRHQKYNMQQCNNRWQAQNGTISESPNMLSSCSSETVTSSETSAVQTPSTFNQETTTEEKKTSKSSDHARAQVTEKKNVTPTVDDPSFDTLKFQNKYLKVRCQTLEKEHKELVTEYKKQLMKENNRWRSMDEQLKSKDEETDELRETVKQMRAVFNNLPARIKRNLNADELFSFGAKLNESKKKSKNKSSQKSKHGHNLSMISKQRNAAGIDKSWRRKN